MPIDVRGMATLREVVHHGSFAGAARSLGYTASALSQQISGLERSLGVQLFQREAKRIVPTEAAEYLVQRSSELFDLIHQIDLDVGRLGAGQAGRLRIGSYHSAGGRFLGPAIAKFLVGRRDTEISLDEGEPHELFPRVADGSLDIALGFEYELAPAAFPNGLRLEEVAIEDLLLVGPAKHRFRSKQSLQLSDLRGETWAAHLPDTPASASLRKYSAEAGFTPNIAFQSNNPSTILGLVASGLAVALLPRISIVERADDLAILPVHPRPPRRRIIAALRESDTSPLSEAFLHALRTSSGLLSAAQEVSTGAARTKRETFSTF